ncbi:MAG TPA: glycoside hydrolase family 130 protein [Polyangiaceae bacterium]|nr:glycoside hydrolase family 130 protein [Polyangiaceae bacterium]
MRITTRRTEHTLRPDAKRVIAKPYLPGEELTPGGDQRSGLLMHRILMIPESEVPALVADVLSRFDARHRSFEGILERHWELVSHHVPLDAAPLSRERKLLIGAFYTHEYSVEGAALFNPSLVVSPDQQDVEGGRTRLLMSLRAVGEGHISSIEFRELTIDAASAIRFESASPHVAMGRRTAPFAYDKRQFAEKLKELGAGNDLTWSVLDRLPERFSPLQLENSLEVLSYGGPPHAISFETTKIIRLLAASSYVTTFPAHSKASERVLFPAAPHETRGMEDARFVRFNEDDGTVRYYATYTAYDGFEILPQLIETRDFLSFSISTLNGAAAQNKGMALFPRRIGGKYVMLSRKDRENLHLSVSDDVHFWHDVTPLDRPHFPWELVQIGNCGSPIETDKGWLVITHGVGPMRRYVLGALLLDLEHPSRVLGRLSFPLLEPDENERDGYVPNVVYSCGSLRNGDDLVLPYGMSDGAIGISIVSLPELLAAIGDAN